MTNLSLSNIVRCFPAAQRPYIRILQECVEKNNSDARYSFGICLLRLSEKFFDQKREKLETLAAQIFKEAADQNHPQAVLSYARLLRYGKGVNKDLNLAAKTYAKACRLIKTEEVNMELLQFGTIIFDKLPYKTRQSLDAFAN